MEEQEEEIEGFKARIFQHELDHLNGKHLLSWSVSEGEVEMLPQAEMEFPNFKKVLDEYKLVIEKKKKEYPDAFKKTVDEINLKNQASDPQYWNRMKKKESQFSEEDIMYQKLKKAIEIDVKNFEVSHLEKI
jgi:Polypeptide deformylase